ncbi:MAG: hypothetical protein IPK78_15345 [Rhodospirillales bacterium]|nr:hypothetical protein [Rhodospirillales bacterium]
MPPSARRSRTFLRARTVTTGLQTDEDAARRLRLAIYGNDEAEYRRRLDLYARDCGPAAGAHLLETWFLRTPIELDWLISRVAPIQHGIFAVKLAGMLTTGTSEPDFALLLNHYRERRNDPAHAAIDRNLLDLDVLTGRLVCVRKRIADGGELADHERRALLGTLEFLAGRNAEAIEHYREALKLYRQHVHKRKGVPRWQPRPVFPYGAAARGRCRPARRDPGRARCCVA